MPVHTEPPLPLSRLLAAVPVLPLPNVVLFPGVVVPLFIFEPRYQQMVRDVMAEARYLVLASPRSPEAPTLGPVGCLAHVLELRPAGPNQCHLLVRGESRVRLLDEQPESRGYRRFRAAALPQASLHGEPQRAQVLATLQHYLCHLGRAAAQADPPLAAVLRASPDAAVTVDYLAASLLRDVAAQQTVLASAQLGPRIEAVTAALADALLTLVGEPLARTARD